MRYHSNRNRNEDNNWEKKKKTMRSNYREVRMTSASSNQNPLLGHPKGFPHDPYPVTTFILTHNT